MTPEHDRIVARLQKLADGYTLVAERARRGSAGHARAATQAETVEFCLRIVEEERNRTAAVQEIERRAMSEMAAQKGAT